MAGLVFCDAFAISQAGAESRRVLFSGMLGLVPALGFGGNWQSREVPLPSL